MTDQKCILVVEDDESTRTGIRRQLVVAGYKVHTADNYADGVAKLDANTYALIISDNGMPLSGGLEAYENAGIELLEYARSQDKHKGVPLVLHTGDDSDKIRGRVAEFGGRYLLKPSPGLLVTIGKLLGEE